MQSEIAESDAAENKNELHFNRKHSQTLWLRPY